MCGIVGFTSADEESLLESMCDSLLHRGPDEAGYYRDSAVSLGMRRLAIIDLTGGQQPIGNEDESIWTVYNGEIYNYESLSKKLKDKGHTFRTKSDTETIVHGYEEWGMGFLAELRGMFGLAVWDTNTKTLILARDRLGEKPLFYADTPDGLVFASEMKAILLKLKSYSIDSNAINAFLTYGFVPGDRTFYSEIKKLPPGSALRWQNGELEVSSYWDLQQVDTREVDERGAIEGTARELRSAVTHCLKSDVEVGAFLSGGLDSSLLTAIMKKEGVNLKTFSVGYKGEATGFNELSYAKKVADHVGTDHHELILEPESSVSLLPKLIRHYDEPHGEPTSALVYHLTEYTSRYVKVAVGGNGADELFLGYPRHKGPGYLARYSLIPKFLRHGLIEPLIRALPESTRGSRIAKRAKRFVNGLSDDPVESVSNWTRLFSKAEVSALLGENHTELELPTGSDQYFREHLQGAQTGDEFLRNVSRLDLDGYLSEYQLCYMDRMSMANSLEVRAPYCDYKLVEYVTSLPAAMRLRNGVSKYVLKEVAREWLPDEIIDRKKVGFDSPIGQWFKDELAEFLQRFLSPANLEQSGLLDPDAVQALIEDHMSGKRDLSLHLWSILALEMWYRMYFEHPIEDVDSLSINDIRGAS